MERIRSSGSVLPLLLPLLLAAGVASGSPAVPGAPAPGFTLLHTFGRSSADGSLPVGDLAVDDAGTVYGLTASGGPSGKGTVFRVSLDGTSYRTIFGFGPDAAGGSTPTGGLVVDPAGNLYGLTASGGARDLGTLFSLRTDGTGFRVLHSFQGGVSGGAYPVGALALDSSGNLYGSTSQGGAFGRGTLFTVRTDGTLFRLLHTFSGGPLDGESPVDGLSFDRLGSLYGATTAGGAAGGGTLFSLQPDGTAFRLLRSFPSGTGLADAPVGLVPDGSGLIYGTSRQTVFVMGTDGTGFRVLHSFASAGEFPTARPTLDGSGNLYGTTTASGDATSSTAFTLRTDGSRYSALWQTARPLTEGWNPSSAPVLDGRGNLLGTMRSGGTTTIEGTLFSVSLPAPPDPPRIAWFTATPEYVLPGQTSTLAWESTGGTGATLDNGIGEVPTSFALVTPRLLQTTTYTLAVTGPWGTSTRSATVTVLARPVASFDVGPPIPRVGEPVLFTDSSTGPPSGWSWDFGDRGTSGERNPAHVYLSCGTFPVTLTASNAAGSGSATRPVPVTGCDSAGEEWTLPGVVYLDGRPGGGAFWKSDVWVVNPDPSPLTLRARYLPADGFVAADAGHASFDLTVPGGGTVTLPGVLLETFALSTGFGALSFRKVNAGGSAPIVSGRTYNAADASGGTYGLALSAVSVSQGVAPRGARGGGLLPVPTLGDNVLVGLRENAQFRTNLAVVNLGTDAAQVNVSFFDPDHVRLGATVSFSLGPGGIRQVNGVLRARTDQGGAGYTAGAPWFAAEVEVVAGSSVFPYASINDAVTNDPVAVVASSRPSPVLRLGGVVWTPGANATHWRTDMVLFNPSAAPRSARFSISFVTAAAPEVRQLYSSSVLLGAGASYAVEDVVSSLVPLRPDGSGNLPAVSSSYLDVAPAADDPLASEPFLLVGKTFTPRSAGGTMGTLVVPVTEADAISASGPLRRLVLPGIEESADRRSGKRTDIAVFRASTTGSSAGATIRILDASGREVARKVVSLGPESSVTAFQQFNVRAILDASGYVGDYWPLGAVVDSVTGTTPVAAYVTTVDNVTGDNTFAVGIPAP